jgi:S-(hydroxymethyl)glutathione dehydrogenase/alcohol dehydrogenase
MKCPAAIADGRGSFSIEEIEIGAPHEGEVIVQIKAAGLCPLDHASLSWKRPVVMGHEGAGVVWAVGAGVSHVRLGEHVVLNRAIPCGRCFQCEHGHEPLCESTRPLRAGEPSAGHAHRAGTLWQGQPIERAFQLGTLGAFALVRKEAVTPVPEEVPLASACIAGCNAVAGYSSVVNVAQVGRGESVAVIGCSGTGLHVVQAARTARAGPIIAVDADTAALARARELGATHAIRALGDGTDWGTAAGKVRALTDGRGVDFAFETTGVPALTSAPLLMIRDGGLAVRLGDNARTTTIPVSSFQWGKRYVAPLYGDCMPGRDFPALFSLYTRGELRLDEFAACTYRLDQLGEALNHLGASQDAQAVILFS